MKRTSNIFVRSLMSASLTLGGASLVMAQAVTVDGTRDNLYGFPRVWQTVQTSQTNNTNTSALISTGSELVAAYSYVGGGNLNLFFSGNLKNGGTKIWLFLDTDSANGQNRLRGDNLDNGGNWALTRMGDRNGANGLVFDSGFAPDHAFVVNADNSVCYVDYSSLPTTFGGSKVYLGNSTLGASSGTLFGGTNTMFAQVVLRNGNTTGVGSGTANGQIPDSVSTGLEMSIPLASLGMVNQSVKVFAFITNSDASVLSNQYLPDVGANGANVGDFGEPRGNEFTDTPRINFNGSPGTQFFYVQPRTKNQLWASRIGNGSALVSSATAVSIMSLAPTGTGQTLSPVLTFNTDTATTMLTTRGTSPLEGFIKRSVDGRFISISGYNLAPGTGTPTASANSRAVATVDGLSNVIYRSIAIGGSAPRTAAAFDASHVLLASSGGTYSVQMPTGTLDVRVTGNVRSNAVVNNRFYGVFAASVGLAPVLPLTTSTASTDFITISGSDFGDAAIVDSRTVFIAENTSTPVLRKWTYNGANWLSSYVITSSHLGATPRTVMARALASGGVNVIVACSDGSIRSFDDSGTGTPSVQILSPGVANYLVPGVDWSPVLWTTPTATNDVGVTNEDIVLTVNAASGVLANDTGELKQNAVLVTNVAPAAGSVTLNLDGSYTFTPAANFSGPASFTYRFDDGDTNSNAATVNLTVNAQNDAPTLNAIGNQAVNELQTLNFTAIGSDVDGPALTYSLAAGVDPVPAGASINPTSGAFTWTPTEAQGAGVYSFSVVVSDGSLSDTKPVQVTVNEVNLAPNVAPIPNQATDELVPFTYQVSATDNDLPAQTLTYSLVGAPAGCTINSAGLISWTPTEAQGPQLYNFTVSVSDGVTATTTGIQVQVVEANVAPVWSPVPAQAATEGAAFALSLSPFVTDADIPAQSFTYIKLAGPTALTISSGGAVAWTPGETDGGTSPTVTVRVVDNGSPTLFADHTFTINVAEDNSAPTLAPIGNQMVNELQTLAFFAVGSDTDDPAQTLTYGLVGEPAGATINPASGAFSWTPAENQGPGLFTFDVTVSDGAGGLDSETIAVTVNEVNVVPVWTTIVAQSATEHVLFSLDVAPFASDSDTLPIVSNNLTFTKFAGPSALSVSSVGLVTWTPGELDGGTSPSVTVRVTDDGAPTLFADVIFTINVAETNSAPVWAVIPAQSASEQVAFAMSLSAFASDSDDPANTLTYELLNGPSGLTVSPSGAVAWTPGETDGGTSPSVQVRVTDNGSPNLNAVTNFTINVAEVNADPVLAPIGNQAVIELQTLTFGAAATDSDLPAQALTYSLSGAPAGASIDINLGTFSWTPTEAQGPGVYSFDVVVTDGTASDSESITVTVSEANTLPTANAQSVNVVEDTATNVTLTGSDADLPAQTLTYTVVSGPTFGSLSGTGANRIYTPQLNFSGVDTFTFKVNDGTADSSLATVTLNVSNVNDMQVSVVGSSAPNAFGSPSWTGYRSNALTSLETTFGNDLGSRLLDPTAYDAVSTIPWSDNTATGWAFWMGNLSPVVPFDQELGHRLHFGVRVLGNGTRFSLSELTFDMNSSDPGNDLNFDGSFDGNDPSYPVFDFYGPSRRGIDYGPDRVKGTGDDIIYNTEATPAETEVDELIYVGIGNAWDATQEPGATPAAKTESMRCYLEGLLAIAPINISTTYKIRDGGYNGPVLASGTGTVTMVANNVLPTANSQSVNVVEDTATPITLSATDPDDATLVYTVVAGPTNGVLSGTGANRTYTPNANYNGPDSFTFKATDCVGDSNIATVTINVTPVNDDPILGAIGNRTIDELVPYSITLGSTDIDGGAPVYSVTSGLPLGASVTGNTFNWTPSELQGPGSYPITFQVNDGAGGFDSETITLTVSEVNVAPTLNPISDITAAEMTLITFDANGQDVDLPGQTLTYSLVNTPPAEGFIDPNTGAFTWTPSETQGPAVYAVTVRVSDGTLFADRTVMITVTEANVAPVLDEIANMTVNEGSPVTFTAHATDSDVPVQNLSYTIIAPPPGSVFDSNTGVFTWTPTEAQGPQTYTFTVKVSDGVTSDEQLVTINVNEVNVAPVALAQTLGAGVNAPLVITLVATDADLPANTLTYSIVSGPSNGVLSGTGASRTYTPNLNYQGPDSFTFKANDGLVDSNVATVNISVSGITVTLDLQLQSFLAAGPTTRGITMFLGGTAGGLSAPVEVTRDVVFTSTGYAQIVFTPADGFNANANLSEYAISIKDNLHSVRKTVPLTWNGSNYVASATLLGGNVNRDNRVDIGDYVVYATRLGTIYPGADTPMSLQAVLSYRNADISGNGSVGTEDFTFISTNFGQGDNNLVGNYNREDLTIRTRISVADAMIEAGRDAARLDRNRDGWISLEEATQRLR